MGIENVTLLGIENVTVWRLPRGGSGATGAGAAQGARAVIMIPFPRSAHALRRRPAEVHGGPGFAFIAARPDPCDASALPGGRSLFPVDVTRRSRGERGRAPAPRSRSSPVLRIRRHARPPVLRPSPVALLERGAGRVRQGKRPYRVTRDWTIRCPCLRLRRVRSLAANRDRQAGLPGGRRCPSGGFPDQAPAAAGHLARPRRNVD